MKFRHLQGETTADFQNDHFCVAIEVVVVVIIIIVVVVGVVVINLPIWDPVDNPMNPYGTSKRCHPLRSPPDALC